MYTAAVSNELGSIGFSLKPPQWLRNIAGSVVRGAQVSVPTPVGTQTFSLNNPGDVDALKKMASGARIVVGGERPPSPIPQNVLAAFEAIPGGWLTIAGVGLALWFLLGRRGR